MASPRLTALRKQHGDVVAGINKIEQAAVADGRDLTDTEQADADKLYERAEQLRSEIEPLATREESLKATSDVLARLGLDSVDRAAPPAKQTDPTVPTAGEYFAEFFRATGHGGDLEEFLQRAATLDRADMITTDNAGILPKPIIGELIKFADSMRPIFRSFRGRPMPPRGKTFSRPRVTQRVQVGEQANELEALASRKMTIVGQDVSKRTFGGSLTISHQDIDWTEPELLQIIVDDFIEVYAEVTEGAACDFLEALITTNVSAYDDTDVGTLVESYVNGAVAVYNSSKRLPDKVWIDLASFATLASTTNTNNDRTALSMIKEALSEMGANGVEWVVGPQLAANTRIIGASNYVEQYEQQKGLLRAERPTSLAHDIAYAGYLAFYARAEAVVGLEAA